MSLPGAQAAISRRLATDERPRVPLRWSDATRLDDVTFESLLRDGRALEHADFDLRLVEFANPAGLIALLLAVEGTAHEGRHATLRLPDSDFRRYLARSRFRELAADVCDLDPPDSRIGRTRYAHRYGRSLDLIELTRIDDAAAAGAFADQTVRSLQHGMGYGPTDAYRIATLVSEAARNVADHAGSHGYGALQSYTGADGRFVQFAIGDGGRGVRARLADNPELRRTAGDLEAIQLAMQPSTSSFGSDRGIGLPSMLSLARTHAGTLQIRSGSGRIRLRSADRRLFAFEGQGFDGTQVFVSLPTIR